ncbi:glycosyltransferase family 9 protein [Streptomyces sp. CA-210063]|uniref:glycosyltransferase family 9 protein n=1 Tax=Streptomyces sp. CA-210063 TaxID=2801029 RepID=UPI00214B02D4|nr:glycosyltransferase family 9 protein [Streptomyces sp. CA-210063]UUU35895.1 glycosyltransferase family 9 protein [Streptomyces sp. CA-210063]
MKALVVCPDGFGGVLLAGPAVRTVATRAASVTVLCRPEGVPAARLLPHVDSVLPWDDGGPPATDEDGPDSMVGTLRDGAYDLALVLGPDGRGPAPFVDLLRSAGIRRVADDCAALGLRRRAGDDGRLRVVPTPDTTGLTGNGPYVVVQPGPDAPEGGAAAECCAETVAALADAGHRVVVTGGPAERASTRRISGDTAVDLGGRTDARTLAGVLRAADVVVAGAPGPAHLAAATGTPVVSLSCPVLPAERAAPYGVPRVLLGDRDGTGGDGGPHRITPEHVVRAVQDLIDEGVR